MIQSCVLGMEIHAGEVSDVLFCRIFFQYMGSLQMPHTWKQGPSLSCIDTCIKRIESEGRAPILVSLELHSNSLKLVNNSGNTIRVFPFHSLVYAGVSTSNDQCMVVVTRSSMSVYSPQPQEGSFGKIMNISHAFRIQPNQSVIKFHGPAKAQRLMRNLDTADYPQDTLRVLKLFIRMFELCSKYEPSVKKPRTQYDKVTGAVVLVDFRNNTHELHSSSSEHSPFMSLQPSSSDGSITDNVSFTVSEHSQKFETVFDNLATQSETRLNGGMNQIKTSSTSLDCISKYQTKHTKQSSCSSLHEYSLLQLATPREKPQNKLQSGSQPCLSNNTVYVDKWMESLDNLLRDPIGVEVFRDFLITQICVENLDFWLAVEKYKSLQTPIEIGLHKSAIFQKFIHDRAPSQVNLEEKLRREILTNLQLPDTSLFNEAQKQVYHILTYDCYPRFKRSAVLSDYIRGNRYAHMKDSVNSEDISSHRAKNSFADIHSSCQSFDPNTSLGNSEVDKPQRHSSNPLSFIRRSFNKRKNSTIKDGAFSNKSSPDDFTFVRSTHPTSQENTEHSEQFVYLHLPGKDKLRVKLNSDQTLREIIRPVLNNLHLLPDLYEYKQADTLDKISLDSNSLFFAAKNIILQQHTESFVLSIQLSTQPSQEYILRTSASKTILDTIQPVLNLKGISKDSISLHLADCNVPIQLDLQSTVLNKQKVEVIEMDNFGTLKVKTGSSTSLDGSPVRDSKQELLKTQYPKRKVKLRTSLRGKKDKSVKDKDMFSLIESAQGNRLNNQRSDNIHKQYLPDKPPRIPAKSNTNHHDNADICPHTGEVLFPNQHDSRPQQYYANIENKPLVPAKERSNKDPPKFTPHKPTNHQPQNLAESRFQPPQVASFAPSQRFNNNNNNTSANNKYHISNVVQPNSYDYNEYTVYKPGIQPHTSLPVAPIRPLQQSQPSLFYKGAPTQNYTQYNSAYFERNNVPFKSPPMTNRTILTVPSPFDECNLPSRMKFTQKLSPISTVHTHIATPIIQYKPSQTNEQKLTHSYPKAIHPPSYL